MAKPTTAEEPMTTQRSVATTRLRLRLPEADADAAIGSVEGGLGGIGQGSGDRLADVRVSHHHPQAANSPAVEPEQRLSPRQPRA
jgi:hypothetical protein